MELLRLALAATPTVPGIAHLPPPARTGVGATRLTGAGQARPPDRARHGHGGGAAEPPPPPDAPIQEEASMAAPAAPARSRCGLSRVVAARCRVALESAGLGPVDIRPAPEGAGVDCILEVRIGPFRRVVATEDEVRALLDERQTCYF